MEPKVSNRNPCRGRRQLLRSKERNYIRRALGWLRCCIRSIEAKSDAWEDAGGTQRSSTSEVGRRRAETSAISARKRGEPDLNGLRKNKMTHAGIVVLYDQKRFWGFIRENDEQWFFHMSNCPGFT